MSTLSHLTSRHLNTELYSVIVNEDDDVATFLLFNLSGQVVGYQQYRPGATKEKRNDPRNGRYFTYITPDTLGVWGLETFLFKRDVLFVTEGIFDACRLHNLGLPAVAVLSNNPRGLHSWLHSLARTVVAVADNDKAGLALMKFGDKALVCDTGKDLGDMTDEEVKELLQNYL
jgi:hypothetical protein